MNTNCCENCLIYNSQDKDRKHPECMNAACKCHTAPTEKDTCDKQCECECFKQGQQAEQARIIALVEDERLLDHNNKDYMKGWNVLLDTLKAKIRG